MKRSIKKLPECTQKELELIVQLLKKEISGCEMIILYGSYARGDYVLWDEYIEDNIRYSYQSDLDILVVVSKTNITIVDKKLHFGVEEKYRKIMGERRHASPQIISEYIDVLNKELEKSQYFFTDIVKEGIMLYNSGLFKLSKPRQLSYTEIKQIAQDYFDQLYPRAEGFFRHGLYAYEDKDYIIGSFVLHQACEKLYNTISLVFKNYRPKNHHLEILLAQVKGFSRELANIFYPTSPFDINAYKLLCSAYIDARYSKDFFVTREQYEYMLDRVKKLKEVTYRICTEKIASYDQYINTNK